MPRDLASDARMNVNLEDLPTNEEDFQLIWLDAHIGSTPDTRRTQTYLRVINSNVQFYTNEAKCLELFENSKEKHILIIVSGVFAHSVLPRIAKLRSVRGVFVFCEAHDLYAYLLNDYSSRITGIYNDRDGLIKSICETMRFIEKHDMVFRVFNQQQNSTFDLSKKSASFLWHSFLIIILRKLPADDMAKNEMLDHCATYYRDNQIELSKVHDFRTSYTPDQAIKYYTDNSFLYKLLNKALRTENIKLLYIFRYFIIHLCDALEKEKEKLTGCKPLTLFRGQQMSTEELENLKNNIGSLIGINGFVSTSRRENIAIGFTKVSDGREGMIQVLFVIKADPRLQTVTFADIKDQSEFKDEEEVLFSLGSVFQVETCYYDDTQSIWRIVLLATDQGSQLTQTFLTSQNEQLQVYSPMIYFGRLVLIELEQIDIAEEYFNHLLNTLPPDHPDLSEVYNQIGAVHYIKAGRISYSQMRIFVNGTMEDVDGRARQKRERQKALNMCQKAFEIRKTTFPDNDIRLANSLNNIGSIYNDWAEYDQALEYYQQALDIFDNLKVDNNIFKGNLLQNIGLLNERQHHSKIALDYYIKAGEICSQCLPIQHPKCAQIMTRIANLCQEIDEPNVALKYYQQAYESCEPMLLPSANEFRNLWENIVVFSFVLNFSDQAVSYLNRVLTICKKVFSSDDSTSYSYTSFLARNFENALDFDKAYEYYSKCARESNSSTKLLSYCRTEFANVSDYFSSKTQEERICIIKFKIDTYGKLFPCDDLSYVSFLREMTRLYDKCQATDLAYHYLQKAFDIVEGLILSDGYELFSCCQSLVDINFKKNDEQSVLYYFERAERIFRNHLNRDRMWIGLARYMALLYANQRDIDKSLEYYDKAFTAAEIMKSYNDIRELLYQIFKICFDNDREQTVGSYIQRAISLCEQDSIELSECCLEIGDFYFQKSKRDDAFVYYERFLLATETKDTNFGQLLDRMWIDFVIRVGDDSSYIDVVLLGSVFNLFECGGICRSLNKSHYKLAIVFWQLAKLNEKMGFYNRAFDHYSDLMPIWEEFIYNRNDTRAIAALKYMWQFNDENKDWFSNFLNFGTFKSRWGEKSNKIDEYSWHCILQQLILFKMIYLQDLWKFHIELLVKMQIQMLSSYIFNKMLQVCHNELFAIENRISLDVTSILCCLEYVSHWYFQHGQFNQSLLYRQYQLDLECKKYTCQHSCVGWSLWFIGLIFYKMREYKLSLEYLNKALQIFEANSRNQKNDIRILHWHIFETSKYIIDEDLSCTNDSIRAYLTNNDKQNYTLPTTRSLPRLLQTRIHMD